MLEPWPVGQGAGGGALELWQYKGRLEAAAGAAALVSRQWTPPIAAENNNTNDNSKDMQQNRTRATVKCTFSCTFFFSEANSLRSSIPLRGNNLMRNRMLAS